LLSIVILSTQPKLDDGSVVFSINTAPLPGDR